MFITLKNNNFEKQYAAFQITDFAGNLLFVGVSKLTEVLSLPGAASLPDVFNVIICEGRDDLMKAANDALYIASDAGRDDLMQNLKKLVNTIQNPPKRVGRPVECIETGQRYFSTNAAAHAHGASYSALQKHLKGEVGYKTVKGKTYRYL